MSRKISKSAPETFTHADADGAVVEAERDTVDPSHVLVSVAYQVDGESRWASVYMTPDKLYELFAYAERVCVR
jgi:hypothetical protein